MYEPAYDFERGVYIQAYPGLKLNCVRCRKAVTVEEYCVEHEVHMLGYFCPHCGAYWKFSPTIPCNCTGQQVKIRVSLVEHGKLRTWVAECDDAPGVYIAEARRDRAYDLMLAVVKARLGLFSRNPITEARENVPPFLVMTDTVITNLSRVSPDTGITTDAP